MSKPRVMYRLDKWFGVKLEAFRIDRVTAKTVFYYDEYGNVSRSAKQSKDYEWFDDLDDARMAGHSVAARRIDGFASRIERLQREGKELNEEPKVKSKAPAPVPARDLSKMAMVGGKKERVYSVVIDGSTLKEWVGIGWIELREASPIDYLMYPQVERKENG